MTENQFPLPSKELMWAVAMTHNEAEFLRVGQRCARELKEASAAAGVPMVGASRVLDWGCGPGRTLRWLLPTRGTTQYFGCDVDKRAVGWCVEALGADASFAVTGAKPPLPYEDGFFDIAFGVSVFTHLNAKYQSFWLHEMRRILRPGGLFMLSLMGPTIADKLPDQKKRAAFLRDGFLFAKAPIWKGIHARWYADAYHSEKYVRETFSRFFEIVAYKQMGMNGHQDLVVMRNTVSGR
jgi:SAM-dependent methyltransferase